MLFYDNTFSIYDLVRFLVLLDVGIRGLIFISHTNGLVRPFSHSFTGVVYKQVCHSIVKPWTLYLYSRIHQILWPFLSCGLKFLAHLFLNLIGCLYELANLTRLFYALLELMVVFAWWRFMCK